MRIENSVTRVTVWHHQACRVMPNSYPEWQNFQFPPISHYGFFFLHKIHLSLFMHYFINFNANTSIFSIKKCLVQLLSTTMMSRHLVENDVKDWRHTVKKTSWHHAWEPSYTRGWCKMTFPCISQSHRNSCRVYKKCHEKNRNKSLIWQRQGTKTFP